MKRVIFLTIVLITCALSQHASAQYIYVDDSAAGANDGSNWANAFNYLQDALELAENGDEIRIAQGTYRPDQGDEVSTGDRTAAFNMIGGVTMKGGYAGFGAPDPNARNYDACKTILSGDLAGNDVEVAFARDLLTETTRADNSYNIIGVARSVIEGFTIKGASNRAMNMYYSNIIVTDCVFEGNAAQNSGGAAYLHNSRAILTRCAFLNNAAAQDGGAICSDGCGTCRGMYGAYIDCVFTGNYAASHGGAVCNKSTTLSTFANCLFTGNTADSAGAALYEGSYNNLGSHLLNCTFSGNSCIAVYIAEHGYATLSNCILYDNLCGTNGGFNAQITRERTTGTNTAIVDHCCIQAWDGSLGGAGNFDADPRFLSPGDWDLNLNYTPGDYRLQPDSPCIDAGYPGYAALPHNITMPSGFHIPDDYIIKSTEEDLDGVPRMVGGRVDAGPYEWDSETLQVIYVDDTATGANNGSSWQDAFNYLQDALDAVPGGHEIWVAQGTYRPDQGDEVSTGDRDATFDLRSNTVIKGGYAGFGEPEPYAREFNEYKTILSGDLAGNDTDVAYARDLLTDGARSDNSYCVVAIRYQHHDGNKPVIEGFTITGANAAGYSEGALFIDHCFAMVTDCIFIDNSSSNDGAGFASYNGRAIFTRCSFIRNAAAENGGAVYIDGCGTCASMYGAYIDCVFTGNYAGTHGGVIYNRGYSLTTCINCLFIGNTAGAFGAALYEDSREYLGSHLMNCTFSGNNSVAIYVAGYAFANLTNCILWDNLGGAGQDAQITRRDTGRVIVNYSCIQGWDGSLGGTGNFDADPRFVASGAWDIDLNYTPGDYHLRYNSPCIDAGDPTYVAAPTSVRFPTEYYLNEADPNYLATSSRTDLSGVPRLAGSGVDAGAYEGTPIPTVYVDDTATGANDGSTWTDAFNHLQDALQAVPPDHEIRIAQGTYRPDRGARVALGDREATFLCESNVIRGGYAGAGAPNPDARNIKEYRTILTGDLAGNDEPLADPAELLQHPARSENSRHVVTIAEYDTVVTLDGLTITGGNADNGGSGGGIFKIDRSPAILTNCTIIANSADFEGGGMYNGGPLEMDKCRFIGNAAETGGGMENGTSWHDPITNCLFTGNFAANDGGGLSSKCDTLKCTNCTFSLNRAEGTGTYRAGGIICDDETDITLTNCILWGNTDVDGAVQSSQLSGDGFNNTWINYCCIQGWDGDLGGQGNFGHDPLFVDADGEDDLIGTEDDNARLAAGSPCINAGDPGHLIAPGQTDLDGNPRISEGRVNMGPYEKPGTEPKVIYVDDSATGANDGSSWQNAFIYLQDAIEAAQPADEIRVAQGTYRPDLGDEVSTGDREAVFYLEKAVTLKGGYKGFGAPDPNTRDCHTCITLLTGDLADNDAEVTYARHLLTETTRDDNSYCLIRAGKSLTNTTTIDGFVIQGAAAGAMHLDTINCDVVITDCVFRENRAEGYGGAISLNSSIVIFTRCSFLRNAAGNDGGAIDVGGGGTYRGAEVEYFDCTFTGNYSGRDGGAICTAGETTTIASHCLFAGNESYDGAAMQNHNSSPVVTNCTFTGNAAQNRGGGMYSRGDSHPIVTNSIFWHNTAAESAGQELYTEYCHGHAASITISFSSIEGGLSGVFVDTQSTLHFGPGNIAQDPCFVDPEAGDYHLKSAGWRWDVVHEEWTFDCVTSRCIDAGNPASPLLDEPLSVPDDPNNEYSKNIRINMGAYGGTAEASLPLIGWSLLADINNDGTVNFCDLAHAGADWNATAPQLPGDLDRNQIAAPGDLSLFADDWLMQTTWRE